MKKLALIVSAAAFLALPAASAQAADIPDVNCGIVSCTYQVEKRVEGAKECVEGAVVAVGQMLQGITPEMQDCSLG